MYFSFLCFLPYARYSLFMFGFLIHFLLVVVALPKKNVFVPEEPVGAGCTRARG